MNGGDLNEDEHFEDIGQPLFLAADHVLLGRLQ